MPLLPKGARSVMASRKEPPDSLDFFCTPPWATRALMEHVPEIFPCADVWEPAAGEGHMAEVLREYFGFVHASDVHDYGAGYAVGSFVGEGPDVARIETQPDWVITNPPFNLASEFAVRALTEVATFGVALLVRTTWLEGGDRFASIFKPYPPTIVALFSERVPMAKGHWDPKGSTATSYSWVVWLQARRGPTELRWIPPGQRTALTEPDDVRRFARAA
jgi:hypothetical protein